jgi:heme/copper-type cytochrome/quinol oxidase subunit 4
MQTDTPRWSADGGRRPVSPLVMAAILIGTVDLVMWYLSIRSGFTLPAEGIDLGTYRAATQSFLGGTGFYQSYQLAGPYTMELQPILYPPSAIPLFALFTVLPSVVWWAIPLGILAWSMRGLPRSRWPIVLALLAWPQTVTLIWAGNPVMWMAAFLALGFGPLVLLKPTLAPFALVAARERRWWLGAAILLVLAVVPWSTWLDYLVVLGNASESNWFYVAGNVPIMLVAWLVRTPISRTSPVRVVAVLWRRRPARALAYR